SANWPLNPRALMAHPADENCATSKLSASRNASGMLDAPERRMSSDVMTSMDAGALRYGSGSFETDVTSRGIRCLRLIFLYAAGPSGTLRPAGPERAGGEFVSAAAGGEFVLSARAIGSAMVSNTARRMVRRAVAPFGKNEFMPVIQTNLPWLCGFSGAFI